LVTFTLTFSSTLAFGIKPPKAGKAITAAPPNAPINNALRNLFL
jgi:hypothetical protein